MDTPLRNYHDRRLAVLTTYRDHEIPIQYHGALSEHNWTRNKAGLFDFGYITIPSKIRSESSEKLTTIGLHGPLSKQVLTDLEIDTDSTDNTSAVRTQSRWSDLWIQETSDLGELGFEISISVALVDQFCEQLSAHEAVRPIGLAAYNSLRIESGLPLQGYEFDVADGSELAPTLDDDQTRLVGLTSTNGAPLEAGVEILDDQCQAVGVVTSTTYGVTVGAHIGLGYVSSKVSYGQTLSNERSNTESNILLTQLPFVRSSS